MPLLAASTLPTQHHLQSFPFVYFSTLQPYFSISVDFFHPSKTVEYDVLMLFVYFSFPIIKIKNVINKLELYDAVLPCINIVDTVWKIEKNVFEFLSNRSSYYRAQTPQGFNFKKILEAHLKNNETWAYDDIYLANKNNFKIMQILGSDFNIKITKPEDLEIAERYLK